MEGKLALIGIRLRDRGTDLSRFREKRSKGTWQVGISGWLADYPDPENFLFLFYGPNGKVDSGGPNATNYKSEDYDKLFREMESMANSPKRHEIIDKMVRTLQHDAPCVWMLHPKSYVLTQGLYDNACSNTILKMPWNQVFFFNGPCSNLIGFKSGVNGLSIKR